jgi:hypothetical protein
LIWANAPCPHYLEILLVCYVISCHVMLCTSSAVLWEPMPHHLMAQPPLEDGASRYQYSHYCLFQSRFIFFSHSFFYFLFVSFLSSFLYLPGFCWDPDSYTKYRFFRRVFGSQDPRHPAPHVAL